MPARPVIGRFAELGYASYASYLRSPHWRRVKLAYRASERPQTCGLCGADEDLDLHHLTYDRLGAELLTDLVALCRRCHALVHVLERRGDASLDLAGIASPERAAHYAALQREAVERAHAEAAVQRVNRADIVASELLVGKVRRLARERARVADRRARRRKAA